MEHCALDTYELATEFGGNDMRKLCERFCVRVCVCGGGGGGRFQLWSNFLITLVLYAHFFFRTMK